MTWTTVWNWKSAVASSVCRALIFFVVNIPAGVDAALAAMQTEFLYRAMASGFFGSLTQYFAQVHAGRLSAWMATAIVAGLAHLVELGVHAWAGTPLLGWSIAASVIFSLVTTRFNLFAMRRGVLRVGQGSGTVRQDLRAMPGVVAAFFRTSL